MQLERLAIRLRPRGGWAAIDLGFRMAATWWRPLWGVWLLVYLPLGLALCVALREQPLAAALILWWLKPLFDRFVLHGLGEAVFGGAPGVASTLSAWRRILSPGLVAALTWRRLGPARSFTLPVTLLERQTGAAAVARRRVLGRRLSGHAVWLTLVCLHFEAVVHTGTSFLLEVLLPPGEEPISALFSGEFDPDAPWWTLKDSLLYLLSVTLIEPFYVAGGFALYLNRRVLLEGWDVELSLRGLARRLAAAGGLARAALLLCALGGAVAWPLPAAAQAGAGNDPCQAEPPAARPPEAAGRAPPIGPELADGRDAGSGAAANVELKHESDAAAKDASAVVVDAASGSDAVPAARAPLDTPARRAIVEVLRAPLFGRCAQETRWERRSKAQPEADEERGATPGFLGLIADIWQVLVWLALAALVVAGGVLIARRWPASEDGRDRDESAPTVLFGLAIAPDSLPPDIAASALALLAAGRAREALSLVYRGALSQLVHRRGLRVARGATEGEVARDAQPRLAPGGAQWLEDLLAQWIAVAYAGRAVDAEAIRALCATYDLHFGDAPAAAETPAGAPA